MYGTGYNGSSVELDMLQVHCRTARKDFVGSWRHIHCLGLLPNTTKCQFCRTTQKSLMTKLLRWKSNKAKHQRIQADIDKKERLELLKFQGKYRTARRLSRQVCKKIKSLKSELQQICSKTARLTMSDLECLVQPVVLLKTNNMSFSRSLMLPNVKTPKVGSIRKNGFYCVCSCTCSRLQTTSFYDQMTFYRSVA